MHHDEGVLGVGPVIHVIHVPAVEAPCLADAREVARSDAEEHGLLVVDDRRERAVLHREDGLVLWQV